MDSHKAPTIDQIDKMVSDFITSHPTLTPKFILMDKETARLFNMAFMPQERIAIYGISSEGTSEIQEVPMIKRLVLNSSGLPGIEVLVVDRSERLLEVVG